MNNLLRGVMVLFSCCCCATASAQEGFTPLFNGEDLSGWNSNRDLKTAGTGAFTVDMEEKAIHCYAGQEAGSKQPIDCLYTEKEFSHFILKLQYKWLDKRFAPRKDHDRDAGLLFHLHGDLKKLWPKCAEMQLGESDAKKTKNRYTTGDLWVIGKDLQIMNQRAGQFYSPGSDPVAVGKGKGYDKSYTPFQNEKPRGQWNEITLTVRGGEGAVFELNGKVVNRVAGMTHEVDGKRVPLEKGRIGLQAEYAELMYRNISIQELQPDAPSTEKAQE